LAALVGLAALLSSSAAVAASHPPLTTRGGIVAADHPDAAKVGARALAKGGNAADAAAATAFALGVLNPMSSGIGGGGFALVYVADENKVYVLDFREVAPGAVTPDHYKPDGELDTSLSSRGGLAVAVPGEVAGLEKLVERFGRKPFAHAVKPAERLARKGFRVRWLLANSAAYWGKQKMKDPWFRKWLAPLSKGDRAKRPKLAKALSTIGKKGARGFYRGWVAKDIVAAVKKRGGVMTLDDLADYEVIEREPLWGEWRGMKLATMPLPSSGGLIVLAALGILEGTGYDLGDFGAGSSMYLHVVGEALEHAFADRARFLGDVGHTKVSMKDFLAPARLKKIAKRISRFGVLDHDDYGDASLGKSAVVVDDAGTSHLCVVDADGNAVALTTTVNLSFGAKVVAPRSGIVLNDEMDDFSLQAGVPNMFGLVQSDANLVGGGKRPLSSMSPTLVFEDDRVVGCVGGSGGPRIISNTVQVLLNVFVHGMDVRAAVEAPRVHHQWVPDELFIEKAVAQDVVSLLRERGHNVHDNWSVTSSIQAIIVRDDGTREAASDPRKGGAPAASD
jgi:gamma-glutamyltranspeptidase/glutathione hydrolase